MGAVAMEASSHGLEQHRVDGTRYRSAVFTNLSQDHLDYHADMEAYFEAKARLFTPELADVGAVNVDDAAAPAHAEATIPVVTFGLDPSADLRALDVEVSVAGISFRVGDLQLRSKLRAQHNVSNCLGVVAAARQLGLDDRTIAEGIERLEVVPGRLESIRRGSRSTSSSTTRTPPTAWTSCCAPSVRPQPAASSWSSDAEVTATAGSGRDGEAATSGADLSVLTSDNPRSEDPMAIIRDVLPGAERGGGLVVEPDRRRAIRIAVSDAQPGDVVVIAGKGHETGQEFADRTMSFDDRVVAREELAASAAGALPTDGR